MGQEFGFFFFCCKKQDSGEGGRFQARWGTTQHAARRLQHVEKVKRRRRRIEKRRVERNGGRERGVRVNRTESGGRGVVAAADPVVLVAEVVVAVVAPPLAFRHCRLVLRLCTRGCKLVFV